MRNVRILTWNIAECQPSYSAPDGWTREKSEQEIKLLIASHDCDAVCLQETTPEFSLGPEYSLLGSSESHCGFVKLFVKPWLAAQAVRTAKIGPAVCAAFSAGPAGEEFHLATFHLAPYEGVAHARQRQRQFTSILRACPGIAVMAGDANMPDCEVVRLSDSIMEFAPRAGGVTVRARALCICVA
jgi:endonuclease/exonuclease/phosphatase family metal-dependent hydrolase